MTTTPSADVKAHWTDRRIAHFRKRAESTRAGEWSDEEIAGRVRMLLRTDMDHEEVLTGARDRIALLSRTVHEASAEIATLQSRLADAEATIVGLRRSISEAANTGDGSYMA